MRFMLLFSRQGKLRLQKWYLATADKDKKKMVRELMQVVLARKPKMCSFLEWRDLKVVYKRLTMVGLTVMSHPKVLQEPLKCHQEPPHVPYPHFPPRNPSEPEFGGVPGCPQAGGDPPGQVCELDIIFNFEKAYFILDEFVMGGEIQDTSKKSVLKAIEQADLLQEVGAPRNPTGRGWGPQKPTGRGCGTQKSMGRGWRPQKSMEVLVGTW
ncbi:AP-1 complex subunit sigma-1A-like [Pyrgilauda ruficollis]|uniref:AP-1 complex subunit sigma-1A-like n=1 Tax=Pyrgilauda ruficollis TaxID=221976 RepID=UPI001B8766B6|nr:AP-1 complex subunit sigma-1A-like [Pyrgilauda ruficollis]